MTTQMVRVHIGNHGGIKKTQCALLCETKNGKCLLIICFMSDFNFVLYTRFYSLSQASTGSEFIWQQGQQQNPRVTNQTMFNVPDLLVVHVLLLTHEFIYNVICLPHSWYPQCDRCSATWSSCARHIMIPPLWFNAVGWFWQMLDCFYWY